MQFGGFSQRLNPNATEFLPFERNYPKELGGTNFNATFRPSFQSRQSNHYNCHNSNPVGWQQSCNYKHPNSPKPSLPSQLTPTVINQNDGRAVPNQQGLLYERFYNQFHKINQISNSMNNSKFVENLGSMGNSSKIEEIGSFRLSRVEQSVQNVTRYSIKNDGFAIVEDDKVNPLATALVHFAGASKQEHNVDLKIICSNGIIQANKEVLITTSGFFYKTIKEDLDFVALQSLDSHLVRQVVLLVTKGRAIVLQRRLSAFLNAVRMFQIFGVYISGTLNNIDGKYKETFPDIEIPAEESQILDPFYKLVQAPGLPETVRCSSCKNVFLAMMFAKHYEEYHIKLTDEISCCGETFATKYDLVLHKKLGCAEVCGVNMSAIYYNTENSGISVNLTGGRTDVNTHSTPIKDI